MKGDRHRELVDNCKISPMGSEGNLSLVTEEWSLAGGIDVSADANLESDVLTVPGGSLLFLILSTSGAGAKLAVQRQIRNVDGSWPLLWVAFDGVKTLAAGAEQGVSKGLPGMLEANARDTRFRLVVSEDIAATAGHHIRMALGFINL